MIYIIIVFIIIIICFFINYTKLWSLTNISDYTYSYTDSYTDSYVDYKKIQAQAASIEPPNENTCQNSSDAKSVCINYSSCCGKNNNNCICNTPSITTCQQNYRECLTDKYFSPTTMQFLGDNKPDTCKHILDNCCDFIQSDNTTNTQKYTHNISSKPDLNNSKTICEINQYKGNLALDTYCQGLCNEYDNCNYILTDKILESCTLFSGSKPIPKEGGATASNDFYKVYTKEGFITTDNNNAKPKPSTDNSRAYNTCINYDTNCTTNKPGSCLCSHTLVKDCHNKFNTCLTTNTPAKCTRQFGNCCRILDMIDISTRFTYTPPSYGFGTDLICDRNDISSATDCQRACSNHDECAFIDTNLDIEIKKNNKPKYCKLYRKSPDTTTRTTLGTPNTHKTIYRKQTQSVEETAVANELKA